jgi:hypothetical protein
MRASAKTAIHGLTHACQAQGRRAAPLAVACRSILPLLLLFLGLSPISRADDFWKHKPPAQWSLAEALKVVRHSPWARLEVVVFLRQDPGAAFSVRPGTRRQKGRIGVPVDSSRSPDAAPGLSPSAAFLVRWESAVPVTQAFARLQELGERAAAEFQAPATRLPMDRYVITVKLEQPGHTGFEPFLVTLAGKPLLRATLKTRRGTVTPLEVEFTGTGTSSSVHFFFPRTLDGAPLLGPGRNSADFNLQGDGFAMHSKFTLDLAFLH